VDVIDARAKVQDPLDWLLLELRRAEWQAHDVIGHLHDGGPTADEHWLDFYWTALLGGRHAMLDRVFYAFACDPQLGLVFPFEPQPSDPEPNVDYPSAGMFIARRAILQRLSADRSNDGPQRLTQACLAAGLKQAVTHVPGVFR